MRQVGKGSEISTGQVGRVPEKSRESLEREAAFALDFFKMGPESAKSTFETRNRLRISFRIDSRSSNNMKKFLST